MGKDSQASHASGTIGDILYLGAHSIHTPSCLAGCGTHRKPRSASAKPLLPVLPSSQVLRCSLPFKGTEHPAHICRGSKCNKAFIQKKSTGRALLSLRPYLNFKTIRDTTVDATTDPSSPLLPSGHRNFWRTARPLFYSQKLEI